MLLAHFRNMTEELLHRDPQQRPRIASLTSIFHLYPYLHQSAEHVLEETESVPSSLQWKDMVNNSPNQTQTLARLADWFRVKKEFRAAINISKEVIKQNADDMKFILSLRGDFTKIGDCDVAITGWIELLTHHPSSVNLQQELATACKLKGNVPFEVLVWKRLVTAYPNDVALATLYADAVIKAMGLDGDRNRAIVILKELSAKYPDSVHIRAEFLKYSTSQFNETVRPLIVRANSWKSRQHQQRLIGPPLGVEMVQYKVISSLNKLTFEKFDKFTNQILEIASQGRYETDGRMLRQVVQLTFQNAIKESTFSKMYAVLCRAIMESIDPNITDSAVHNKDGQPLTGGQLFRKYLLNRCQEEFERFLKHDENVTGKKPKAQYVVVRVKRRDLGLILFIGELFKLNMITQKIMYALHVLTEFRYECIVRLLGGTDDPRAEPHEVEILCRLLNNVGRVLDEGEAKVRMNAIYNALDRIRLFSDLESRIKFKILVCITWLVLMAGRYGLTESRMGYTTNSLMDILNLNSM